MGCKLLPEPCQVGAQVLDARDIRACVHQVCTRVCAMRWSWIGAGRACEDVPGQHSSTLLRAEARGTEMVRENSLSQSFRSESVIGRDIIDR